MGCGTSNAHLHNVFDGASFKMHFSILQCEHMVCFILGLSKCMTSTSVSVQGTELFACDCDTPLWSIENVCACGDGGAEC